MSNLDYEAVHALRLALSEQADDLEAAAFTAEGHDSLWLTRGVVACETAADALFDVMNVAASYLNDSHALACIARWHAPDGTG